MEALIFMCCPGGTVKSLPSGIAKVSNLVSCVTLSMEVTTNWWNFGPKQKEKLKYMYKNMQTHTFIYSMLLGICCTNIVEHCGRIGENLSSHTITRCDYFMHFPTHSLRGTHIELICGWLYNVVCLATVAEEWGRSFPKPQFLSPMQQVGLGIRTTIEQFSAHSGLCEGHWLSKR